MMFFSFGIAYSLELIALVFGVGLFIFLKTHQNKLRKGLLLFVAWLVIVISSLSIICTTVHTIKFWSGGYYKSMMMMHKHMMEKGKDMMEKSKDMMKSDNGNY
ncbi:MAG: hypothetical protein WCT85_02195 [Parachlamydiales bacterium]|jgi:hypothetical protein